MVGIQLQLLVGVCGTDDVVHARQAAPVDVVPAHAWAARPSALEVLVVVLGLLGRREHATDAGAGSFRVLYQEEDLHVVLRGSARGTGRWWLVPLGIVLLVRWCCRQISRGRPRRSRPRPARAWPWRQRPDGDGDARSASRRAPRPRPPRRAPAWRLPSSRRRSWCPGDDGWSAWPEALPPRPRRSRPPPPAPS